MAVTVLSIAWTLPSEFQVWGGLIGAVTSATVFTYMPGPVSLGAFRRHLPGMARPFRLPVAAILSPLAFVASTLLIYWSGWSVNIILIPILILAWVGYALFGKKNENSSRDLQCAWWLLAYYVLVLIISYLGTFGGINAISSPTDMVLVVIASLVCYYWGIITSLSVPEITDEDELASGQNDPATSKYAHN